MSKPLFDRIALLGIGLIGSSLARVIAREGLAGHVAISTRSADTLKRAEELRLETVTTRTWPRVCVTPISSSFRCPWVRLKP